MESLCISDFHISIHRRVIVLSPTPSYHHFNMAADAEMVSADTHKDASKTETTASEPAASVQADIQHNLTLLRSAVSILEPRLTTKVLRTLGSIRKRLDAGALKEAIEAAFPSSE